MVFSMEKNNNLRMPAGFSREEDSVKAVGLPLQVQLEKNTQGNY